MLWQTMVPAQNNSNPTVPLGDSSDKPFMVILGMVHDWVYHLAVRLSIRTDKDAVFQSIMN